MNCCSHNLLNHQWHFCYIIDGGECIEVTVNMPAGLNQQNIVTNSIQGESSAIVGMAATAFNEVQQCCVDLVHQHSRENNCWNGSRCLQWSSTVLCWFGASTLERKQLLEWQPLLAMKLNSAVLIWCIKTWEKTNVAGDMIQRTVNIQNITPDKSHGKHKPGITGQTWFANRQDCQNFSSGRAPLSQGNGDRKPLN